MIEQKSSLNIFTKGQKVSWDEKNKGIVSEDRGNRCLVVKHNGVVEVKKSKLKKI